MTRHIDRQIGNLKEKIRRVGTVVEEAISKSISAVINRDVQLAQRVLASDDAIDRMEVEVEEECLKILALYQPVAADLRFVVAVLKINNDLERMGDLAKNIAKRVAQLEGAGPVDLPPEIRTMAMQAEEMVRECLAAVIDADPVLARRIREQDDVVDQARQKVRKRILAGIKEHPENVEVLLRINSITKHIERIADMATNVAEDVIYMVEGDIVRHRPEE
ncbi:MAG: phosphate transport system regulatory protein PhoU [Planctomycetota bacterium]|jgi:phosphate transport system protein|nr:MAG: phosphate transport system regulatory protein PhoU [Planctomycetota bacterium]